MPAAGSREIGFEFCRIGIDNEFLRKIIFCQYLLRENMVSYVEIDMRIAVHDDGYTVFFAERQHDTGIFPRALAASLWLVGAVIDLKQYMMLFCRQDNLLKINGKFITEARMFSFPVIKYFNVIKMLLMA